MSSDHHHHHQQNSNYDLMLLQLCFDVSEFDDLIIDDEEGEQQRERQQLEGEQEDQNSSTSSLSFDPFSFVASRQQHVSLEQLESDLKKYANHLNQAMLACVHDEVYESFTNVAAQLGNTSKRLSTVKAPLAHYLERIKTTTANVEKAKKEIEKGLQEAANAENERRFYAARVETALLARSLHQFLTSSQSSTAAASSVSPIRNNNNNKIASDSISRKSLSEEIRGGYSEQDGTGGGSSSSRIIAEQDKETSLNETATLIHSLLEQLPTACHSLRRLNQLIVEMKSSSIYSGFASSNNQHQHQVIMKDELDTFFSSCSILERDLLALMCSVFDLCYFGNPNVKSDIRLHLPEMKRICELFCSMERVGSFVEHFKDAVVRPVVEDVVSWRAASQARQSPEEAAKLLNTLKQSLLEDVNNSGGPLSLVPLLQQALGGFSQNENNNNNYNSSSHHNSHSLIIASWSATSDTIMKRALFLFNPGMPSHFQKHFLSANQLLTVHEKKCGSTAELCALRTSSEVALWIRKWNVDVYHALRQKDLNQTLDEEILVDKDIFTTTAESSSLSSATEFFKTATISKIFSQIKRLIDPKGEIFLFALQHRFLRDVYNTIQKLISKAKSVLEAEASTSSSVEDVKKVVSRWSALRADFSSLSNEIKKQLPPLLEQGCAGAWSEATATLVSPVEFCSLLSDEVSSSVSSFDSIVKSSVAKQCMNNLANVKMVKTAFSMTKKNVPTEPSAYLNGALQPLSAFHSALAGSADARSIIQDVATEILNEFADLVKEIVISSRKAQESLEKLRRAREQNKQQQQQQQQGQTATANNTSDKHQLLQREATDRDKIVVQLYLDINELVNVMRKFGINAESFAPFKALFALVKRASWVLSNFEGEEPEEIEE